MLLIKRVYIKLFKTALLLSRQVSAAIYLLTSIVLYQRQLTKKLSNKATVYGVLAIFVEDFFFDDVWNAYICIKAKR